MREATNERGQARASNAAQINADEKLTADQRNQLKLFNDRIAKLRADQITRQEDQRLKQEALQLTQQGLRDQDTLLQLQSRLADSQKERRAIELRRVDIAYQLERNAIAEELAAAQAVEDQQRIAAAKKALANVEERKASDTQIAKRDTETPLQQYTREVSRSGNALNDDIETIAVDGIKSLNDGLADAIARSDSLGHTLGSIGDVFHDVSERIIADLIRIGIEKAIVAAIGSAFGGVSGGLGGGIGSLVTGIFGSLFGGSNDASVGHGLGSLTGIPGWASGGSMVIGGNGGTDRNLLSLNGSPVARVGRGETLSVVPNARASRGGGPQPVLVQLAVRRGEAFEPLVQRIAGDVSVQTVTAATPRILDEAGRRAPQAVQRAHRYGSA